MPKFRTGKVFMTSGINYSLKEDKKFLNEIVTAFEKYLKGIWGDMCEEDKKANDDAVVCGSRIVASYNTSKGKVYMITEYDRSYTTILFAKEY